MATILLLGLFNAGLILSFIVVNKTCSLSVSLYRDIERYRQHLRFKSGNLPALICSKSEIFAMIVVVNGEPPGVNWVQKSIFFLLHRHFNVMLVFKREIHGEHTEKIFRLFAFQGLKLRPIQSHLRLNVFPLRLKYLEKSQICDLFSSSLFRNKRVSRCRFAALFTKINEEMTKLFCFSP